MAPPSQAEPGSYPKDAWELLNPRLTDQRREKMLRVVANRTRRIRLVVQDIHHPHNVSACLRSAEAFGIQDVDVVCLQESFRPSTVARGVTNWLTIRRHHTVNECVERLRSDGFSLAAGVPADDATPLPSLPVDKPLAVLFGNEHGGLHPDWVPHIDHRFTIPMVGFVESLNISVSAAVTLNQLTSKAKAELPGSTYDLTEIERQELLCAWICTQISSWRPELDRLRQG